MTASPRVAELALAAGDYVRASLAVELDGSAESLAYVDHYLSTIGKVSEAVLALVSAAIGSYFGEVAIARFGGSWRADDEDPAAWTVTLEAAPVRFRPVAMAAEAIRRQDLPDWDASIHVPSAWEAEIESVLESSGPVEEAYYYSLTGRLETIEHTAELLAELRRRGEASENGVKGEAGDNGEAGEKGEKGEKGESGENGENDEKGKNGKAGGSGEPN